MIAVMAQAPGVADALIGGFSMNAKVGGPKIKGIGGGGGGGGRGDRGKGDGQGGDAGAGKQKTPVGPAG